MPEGKRVRLRALTPADVPRWASWFNDAAVTAAMNKGAFPVTEAQQTEFLGRISASPTDIQFAVVSKDDDTLVGTIGIHKIDWIHRHASISVVIGERQYWGRGLGTEAVGLVVRHAFTKLNLHRLTAGMWAPNEGSRHCFEQNGFRREGTLRESFSYEGRYVDEYVYGLLQQEWEARGGGPV